MSERKLLSWYDLGLVVIPILALSIIYVMSGFEWAILMGMALAITGIFSIMGIFTGVR